MQRSGTSSISNVHISDKSPANDIHFKVNRPSKTGDQDLRRRETDQVPATEAEWAAEIMASKQSE